MTQGWRALTREQLDWAYDQRHHAPNMQEVMARLTAAGHQAQAGFKQRQRIAYGTESIEMLDWYSCQKEGAPVLFFVHGGAWRSGEAKDFAFWAASPSPRFTVTFITLGTWCMLEKLRSLSSFGWIASR
jgi:acetyl esterase/lipase